MDLTGPNHRAASRLHLTPGPERSQLGFSSWYWWSYSLCHWSSMGCKHYGHTQEMLSLMIHLQIVHWPWTVIHAMKLLMWSRLKLKKLCMFMTQWNNIIKYYSIMTLYSLICIKTINWCLKRQLSMLTLTVCLFWVFATAFWNYSSTQP